MSSDSAGPLGGQPNLGLAPPRRFNKFQMGDLASAFLIGWSPLHLDLAPRARERWGLMGPLTTGLPTHLEEPAQGHWRNLSERGNTRAF